MPIDFGINIIEQLLAAIPQIVILLSTILYYLKAVKKKTTEFPKEVLNTRVALSTAFDSVKSDVIRSLSDTKLVLIGELNTLKEDIHTRVSVELNSMQKQLLEYRNELKSSAEQINLIVRENKVFLDIIALLVASDPNKIKSNAASLISQKVKLLKNELQEYPNILIKDMKLLENALREALIVLGEDEFKKLLERAKHNENTEEKEKS